MKKSTRQIAYLLVGIVALVLIVDVVGFYDVIPGFPPTASTQPPPQSWNADQKSDYDNGIGMFNVRTAAHDTLAPATALTLATNVNIYWYSKRGTTWIYHDVNDNKYVDLTPEDNGYMYMAVAIPASQNYYVDADKITTTNSYVEQVQYIDVDSDTVKEFVFKFDMKGHSIPSSGYPVIWFHGHCWAYDNAFTGLNTPAALTSIGGTTVTKWINWQLSFSAVAKAAALSKVELRSNITDTSKCKLQQIEIPGRGFLDASNLILEETASWYRYTYTYGNTFDTAYYLNCPTGHLNQFDMDVKLEFTLGTSNMTWTLYVYYLVAQTEVRTSTSTTVDCSI